jgi:hypothetical protein
MIRYTTLRYITLAHISECTVNYRFLYTIIECSEVCCIHCGKTHIPIIDIMKFIIVEMSDDVCGVEVPLENRTLYPFFFLLLALFLSFSLSHSQNYIISHRFSFLFVIYSIYYIKCDVIYIKRKEIFSPFEYRVQRLHIPERQRMD